MWTWPWKSAATPDGEHLQRAQEARDAAKAAEAAEAERLLRDKEARDAAETLIRAERRARWATIFAAAGLVVSISGGVFGAVQTDSLRQQVELQKQELDISGPVLTGTALIIDEFIGPRLFNPGTGGIERVYEAGETADRDREVRVRIEVTNRGRSVGAVTGAAVQHGGTWLSAHTLMCGVADDNDGSNRRLVECQLPIKVEPGGIAVFTFDLPEARCTDNGSIPDKEEIIASFTTTTGEVAVPSTKVFGWMQDACPRLVE
ncbi:hypothetical protein EU811_20945 [Arthrobacter sp. TS-15]|uniref:hypothetical protein n=1 Tax=Arthrobacter sp. TS-15 TaxID=2510797 RepID=UPI00115E188F|nr:hypothetical protein [Arthrobacter sp. TS-15]TQS88613.1 hypothetical protein EU811_20945 [Arthrobacter sp. TS-15]